MSDRNGPADGISTQTLTDFPAGNYTFQYEWSAVGGAVQGCSTIKIAPFPYKTPPFDWTVTTLEYFSKVSFKIGTLQSCWGYGGQIRIRSLRWTRKQGNI